MNNIDFVYCNKIYILKREYNSLFLTEKDSGKTIKITEEHHNIDIPLFDLIKLIIKLI